MERINNAAVELIVEKGYGGASISAIARKAGVAEGYLYRFHASKWALVNHLLHSKINSLTGSIEILVKSYKTFSEICAVFVGQVFSMAKSQPQDLKFLYVLMHDYNFLISEEQRREIKDLIGRVNQMGKESGEINEMVTDEEIYQMVITYPIVFLNMRLKGFFGNHSWDEQDQDRVTRFCINALK